MPRCGCSRNRASAITYLTGAALAAIVHRQKVLTESGSAVMRNALTLMVLNVLLSGCVTVDVKLSSFMSPDRGRARPHLAPRIRRSGHHATPRRAHGGDHTRASSAEPDPHCVLWRGSFSPLARRRRSAGGARPQRRRRAVRLSRLWRQQRDALTSLDSRDGADRSYDYASALETSAGKKRVLYGFSLGGLVAAHVAGLRESEGLMLEPPRPMRTDGHGDRFPGMQSSPRDAARSSPRWLRWMSPRCCARYRGEVLILSGTDDRHAPASSLVEIDRALRQQHGEITARRVPSIRAWSYSARNGVRHRARPLSHRVPERA